MDQVKELDVHTKLITIMGYLCSSMAIAIHLFIHMTTDTFRNFPGHLLVSNCFLLLMQYSFSLVHMSIAGPNQPGSTLYDWDYYYTALVWSLLTRVQFTMAFDLWNCLRTKTTNVKFACQQGRKFFKYMAAICVSPLLQISLMAAAQKLLYQVIQPAKVDAKDNWNQLLLYYFISDMILMCCNFILYAICVVIIYRTRSSIRSENAQNFSNFVFYVKVCGRLFIMSEMNYTMLIIVYKFGQSWLKQAFTYFMAYHGFIVFVFVVLDKILRKNQQQRSAKMDTENTVLATATSTM